MAIPLFSSSLQKIINAFTSKAVAAALCLLLASQLAGCGGSDKKKEKAAAGPPVQVVQVTEQTVQKTREYVGQTQAKQTVDVRARVEGFLEKRLFDEGSIVQRNQTLFIIQPDQYRDKLTEAKAQLASDRAVLSKARVDYGRFKDLVDQGAVSREEFDTVATQYKEAMAAVEQDNAQLNQAHLNLTYTTVRAPITGRIGRTQVDLGALVGKGENTLLAVISEVDPIYVNFSISEREYLEIMQFAQSMKEAEKIEHEDYHLPLQLILADNSVYPHDGVTDMADRAVDALTGTLGVRAVFPNPEGVLRPGQYAKIRVVENSRKKEPVAPQVAVMDVQGQKMVYVVGKDNVVEARPIKTGLRDKNLIVVEQGLKPGETIITSGLQKVRPGMKVTPTKAANKGGANQTDQGQNGGASNQSASGQEG
jgi:membrane fusion protein (multidrug efflux system)